MEQLMQCEHRDKLGNLTFDKEDDRVTTDRGTFGSVWYCCRLCGDDITEIVIEKDNEDRYR
jgi:hypothetical protein